MVDLKCSKRKGVFILAMIIIITMLMGCGNLGETVKLDTKKPVTISVWHYYNGSQKKAFDDLVSEFNNTVGKERGIIVNSHNKGDVMQLEESVLASLNKEIGSDEIPNVFASYADTAFNIEEQGYLVDIGQYMTEKEIAEYVDSYIEEGRIGTNGELKIFPVGKSTEVFMMNKTDWKKFVEATGTSLVELETKEGIVKVAEKYYNWTDSLTPDIANDGKAFYGRDSMANLFVVGSMQLGTEIFKVENKQLSLDLNIDVMHKIWECYYVPYVKGYFSSFGRFRSDDVKTGEIIAFTGSSTAADYFPKQVEKEDAIYEVEFLIRKVPVFEGGEDYVVQQGAGMVVVKGTKEQEYASVEFLKWFTQKERNIKFSIDSGYMPVKKDASSMKSLEENPELAKDETLVLTFEIANSAKMYTNKAFTNGGSARKVLEYNLADKAVADREKVKGLLASGMDFEEALADFTSQQAFEIWYNDFTKEMQAAIDTK